MGTESAYQDSKECIGAIISNGSPVYQITHAEELIGLAVRSSGSAAGVLPPVPSQGGLLVDGSDGDKSISSCADYGESLSGRQAIWLCKPPNVSA